MRINIRIPYWATKNVAIKVNGKLQHVDTTPSSYATLHRSWKTGDTIQVSLPMSLHTDPTPDDPTVQAMPEVQVTSQGIPSWVEPCPAARSSSAPWALPSTST